MDLNEYREKIDVLEKKIEKINQNMEILTAVFEGILDQFEKIKKEIKK